MKQILQNAVRKKQKSLSEYESKLVIAAAGVPIARQELAASGQEAVAAAEQIGYPVVMKGCGAALTHKTEMGLVKLNIRDAEEAAAAYDDLTSKGIEMDGILVMETISGDREFTTGLLQDPQFGPCVMFGLGGIFAEALNDVSFRAAPLTGFDARDMIQEISAQKLLGDFRGKTGVDMGQAQDLLVGIGQLGLENDEIAEIDINPLILRDGRLTAVDALVVLKA